MSDVHASIQITHSLFLMYDTEGNYKGLTNGASRAPASPCCPFEVTQSLVAAMPALLGNILSSFPMATRALTFLPALHTDLGTVLVA